MTMTCSKCGQPMPELDDDLAALARRSGGVTLAHEVCPGETPPAELQRLRHRYFEVRVKVVEVIEHAATDDADATVDVVEFFDFSRGVRAPNLDQAMRPLALSLGERWEEAERAALIADSDPADAAEVPAP